MVQKKARSEKKAAGTTKSALSRSSYGDTSSLTLDDDCGDNNRASYSFAHANDNASRYTLHRHHSAQYAQNEETPLMDRMVQEDRSHHSDPPHSTTTAMSISKSLPDFERSLRWSDQLTVHQERRGSSTNNNNSTGIFASLNHQWLPEPFETDSIPEDDVTDDEQASPIIHHRKKKRRDPMRPLPRSLRRRMFLFLTEPTSSIGSAIFFLFLVVAIFVMNALMIMQTMNAWQFTPTDCITCGG
jgi:hypothetical protein